MPSNKIILTADMIKAGVVAWDNWERLDDPYVETLVRQIFHAMVAPEWAVQDESVHEFGHIYEKSKKIADDPDE